MNVEFATNELRLRAGSEAASARAWGPIVGRKYIQRIRQLYVAKDFHSLRELRALRLHPLRGDREGSWSLTLHDRWRLVVRQNDGGGVTIEEVSNHYDD